MDASADRTRRVARRYVEEVWNEGNVDAMDELLTADQLYHDPTDEGAERLQEFRRFVRGYREAFPDLRDDVDGYVAEGDTAAFWGRVTGTHEGPFWGSSRPGTGSTSWASASSESRTGRSRNAGRTSTCSGCSDSSVSIPGRHRIRC